MSQISPGQLGFILPSSYPPSHPHLNDPCRDNTWTSADRDPWSVNLHPLRRRLEHTRHHLLQLSPAECHTTRSNSSSRTAAHRPRARRYRHHRPPLRRISNSTHHHTRPPPPPPSRACLAAPRPRLLPTAAAAIAPPAPRATATAAMLTPIARLLLACRAVWAPNRAGCALVGWLLFRRRVMMASRRCWRSLMLILLMSRPRWESVVVVLVVVVARTHLTIILS